MDQVLARFVGTEVSLTVVSQHVRGRLLEMQDHIAVLETVSPGVSGLMYVDTRHVVYVYRSDDAALRGEQH